jgi:hypothetical protein
MKPTFRFFLGAALIGSVLGAGQARDSMAPIPTQKRASLTKRVEAYVKANQERKCDD